tara:strand:+ start:9 stop:146 length:138 start_codon:yes stop_codon:yes gene_type:complete
MDKHMQKLIKYFEQADGCLSREKAQKLIKKAEKATRKHLQRRGDD